MKCYICPSFPRIGYVDFDYSLCLVCRRRFEPEVFVVECFLSDNLPFGTGTYHGYFFLQQYAVSSATEIYIFFVGDYHAADPLAASRYTQSLNNALAQGHRYDEAVQIATHSLYGTLQEQSLLLALKEILGYLLVISVIIAVISRFIPFHKTIRVTFAKTGDDMV